MDFKLGALFQRKTRSIPMLSSLSLSGSPKTSVFPPLHAHLAVTQLVIRELSVLASQLRIPPVSVRDFTFLVRLLGVLTGFASDEHCLVGHLRGRRVRAV